MFRFWNELIYPILKGVDPKTIVEIGALRGQNTANLLKFCAGKRQLHSIDPLPGFDTDKMMREHEGHLFFHKDLSLKALPKLPMFEVALIDGDHNWYTVYNELKLIAELHGNDSAAFPVLLFHDVCWPYGRRDLYYSHTTIPESYRHPFATKGIQYGKSELSDSAGLNITLPNAEHEGGEKNGVLTAIEDFVSASPMELCFHEIPACFGFGLLYTGKRLENSDSFRQIVEYTFSAEGLMRILRKLEEIRSKDVIAAQQFMRRANLLQEQLDKARNTEE